MKAEQIQTLEEDIESGLVMIVETDHYHQMERQCICHKDLREACKALLIQFERFAKLTYEAEGHPHDLENIFHKWPEVRNAKAAIAEAEKGE